MNEELQAAIIAALVAGLPDLDVYGAVPQDTDWPYVVCGTPASEPFDTNTSDGAIVRHQVRLFAAEGAVALATQFVDRVRAILHHTDDIALSSAAVINVYVEGSSIDEPSEDGKARETVVTVAFLLDDITPGTN